MLEVSLYEYLLAFLHVRLEVFCGLAPNGNVEIVHLVGVAVAGLFAAVYSDRDIHTANAA